MVLTVLEASSSRLIALVGMIVILLICPCCLRWPFPQDDRGTGDTPLNRQQGPGGRPLWQLRPGERRLVPHLPALIASSSHPRQRARSHFP